jgi:hypothetical protein
MESAGVTLVKGDLRGIAKARRLSHEQHSAECFLCVFLQCAWDTDCRRHSLSGIWPAAESNYRERRDEPELPLSNHQRAQAEKLEL